jgi:hypothetical protein
MFMTVCMDPCEEKDNQVWSIVSFDGINWKSPIPLLTSDLGPAEPSAIYDPDPKSGRVWRVFYTDRLDARKIKMVEVNANRRIIKRPQVVYTAAKDFEGTLSGVEIKELNGSFHLFFNVHHLNSSKVYSLNIYKVESQNLTKFTGPASPVVVHEKGSHICAATTPGILPRKDGTYHLLMGLVNRSSNQKCDLTGHRTMHIWKIRD